MISWAMKEAVRGDSTIPYRTNGFIVVRIANDGATTTVDLYHNPPLSGLPATPDLTVDPDQNGPSTLSPSIPVNGTARRELIAMTSRRRTSGG